MGMYTGKFNVIDPANPNQLSAATATADQVVPQSSCSMGGCGCGMRQN
jgi:hypothetical protein